MVTMGSKSSALSLSLSFSLSLSLSLYIYIYIYPMRWEDCVLKFLHARGVKWGELAKDRDAWRAREDEFVKFEA